MDFFFAMNSQGFSCLPACTYLGDRLVSENIFVNKNRLCSKTCGVDI